MKWFRIGIMLLIVVSTIVGGKAYAQIAPTVKLLSPRVAEVVLGSEVTVVMEAAGTTITRPDGSKDAAKTHFQLFLDINPPAGTGPVPVQAPYVHTTATSYTFKDLKPGEHTLILQLAYGDHSPVQPPVQQTIKFTTREAKKIGLFGTTLAITATALTLDTKQGVLNISAGPGVEVRGYKLATGPKNILGYREITAGGPSDVLGDVAAGQRLTILANTADGVYSAIKIMVIPGEPENKHIVGAITSISATAITVVDPTGKIIIIDRTPETKFLLPQGATEPRVGDFVTVVGHVDKDSGRVKAQPITVHPDTVQAEQNAINVIRNLQYILKRAPDQARPGLEDALRKMKELEGDFTKAVGGNVDKVKKDWSSIEGTGRSAISSLDKTAKTVTISLPSGENLTIKIVASTRIERDEKEATVDSLAVGDRVEKVSYDAATLEARKVYVDMELPGKAVGKDLDNLKTRLEEMAIRQQDVFYEFKRKYPKPQQVPTTNLAYETALTALGGNVGRVKAEWDKKEKEKAQEREKVAGRQVGALEKELAEKQAGALEKELAETPAPTPEPEKARTPTPLREPEKQQPTPTPAPTPAPTSAAPSQPAGGASPAPTPAPTPTPTPVPTPQAMPTGAPPSLKRDSPPHLFYGKLTFYKKDDKSDAYTAPVGAVVSAVVGNSLWESQPSASGQGFDYSITVKARDSSDKKLIFYVNGVKADQAETFQEGGVTKLDLTVRLP